MFNNSELMVYKLAESRSSPLLLYDDGTTVEFSMVAAHQETVKYVWFVQGSEIDGRLHSNGIFTQITPILLSTEPRDTRFLEVRVDAKAGGQIVSETIFLELQSKPATLINSSLLFVQLSLTHSSSYLP